MADFVPLFGKDDPLSRVSDESGASGRTLAGESLVLNRRIDRSALLLGLLVVSTALGFVNLALLLVGRGSPSAPQTRSPADGVVDVTAFRSEVQYGDDIPRYDWNWDNYTMKLNGFDLGDQLVVYPTKLGLGVNVLDLKRGLTLASLWYSNWGDENCIAHHIQAFPSANPRKGFDVINSCQGGANTLLYNIPTKWTADTIPQATNFYLLHFDGNSLSIAKNYSDISGLGLGVHVCVKPDDAKSFTVSDGQKDVNAWIDKDSGTVKASFRYDWIGNNCKSLKNCWAKGGNVRITKLRPDPKTGKYDLLGTKGNKITVELVPMAEGQIEQGLIPGPQKESLVAADGFVWHPTGKWAAEILRMLGGAVVHDMTSDAAEPYLYISFNEDTLEHRPVQKVGDDTWEIELYRVDTPSHELGFSPDGHFFLNMANVKLNGISVYDSSDPDPKKWKRLGVIRDPLWKGMYPSPFHMTFHPIYPNKVYIAVLNPIHGDADPSTKESRSSIAVVDLTRLRIVKEIRYVVHDTQSMGMTDDGRYLLIAVGGFQRYESGTIIVDTSMDEIVGFLPGSQGSHDIAVVYSSVEKLKNSRSTAL
ncbi:hypothetical protein DFJ74DRAFT_702858 [Hyaloraphidium curvatum]|nr:hypothetical protein DFJ74DRAFT_702858 [Hyaloraphidium curvatum]